MAKPTRRRKAKAASTRKTVKRARPKTRAARGKAHKGKKKAASRKAAPAKKIGRAPKRPAKAPQPEPRPAGGTHPLEGAGAGPEVVQREPRLPGTGTDGGGEVPAADADEPV